MDLTQAVSDYGFPIIMSVGMGYFIYYNNETSYQRQQLLHTARLERS